MTRNWASFWSDSNNDTEIKRLAEIFDYLPEWVGRSILNQIDARKDHLIAEFGCGNGALLSFIEGKDSKEGRTVGIDFSKRCIDNNLSSKNSLLLNDDVCNVELKSESVDRSFCYSLFNYLTIDEATAALKEMLRVTKVGGFVLVGNVIRREFADVMDMKLNGIRCPQFDMDFNNNILSNMAEEATSDKSKHIVYDNDVLGYENSKLTSNLLIWKL